jgi:hypothetical protein
MGAPDVRIYIHTHTYIYIGQGVGVRFPTFWRRVDPLCFFSYTCGRRGAVKPDSSLFPTGSCRSVSRRYPDYAERPHAVLSREGGPQILGLASRETVTCKGSARCP